MVGQPNPLRGVKISVDTHVTPTPGIENRSAWSSSTDEDLDDRPSRKSGRKSPVAEPSIVLHEPKPINPRSRERLPWLRSPSPPSPSSSSQASFPTRQTPRTAVANTHSPPPSRSQQPLLFYPQSAAPTKQTPQTAVGGSSPRQSRSWPPSYSPQASTSTGQNQQAVVTGGPSSSSATPLSAAGATRPRPSTAWTSDRREENRYARYFSSKEADNWDEWLRKREAELS